MATEPKEETTISQSRPSLPFQLLETLKALDDEVSAGNGRDLKVIESSSALQLGLNSARLMLSQTAEKFSERKMTPI